MKLKEKNSHNDFQEKEKEKKISKAKKSAVNSSQSYLPIASIQDGIVHTKEGKYVKIIEFFPINFSLKSTFEQNSIIASFASLLKIIPNKIQFKIISQKANMEEFVDVLKMEMDNEKSDACREMQKNYIEFVKEIGQSEGVKRRFFFIFEHIPSVFNRRLSYEEVLYEIQITTSTIKTYMAQCGNEIVEITNSDEEICKLFYEIFQRKSAESISFKTHIEDILEHYQNNGVDVIDLPIIEFLAPQYIDNRNSKYICIDGMYYAYGIIPSDRYNQRVYGGWTSAIVNLGEGIDVDMFLSRTDKASMQRKIGQNIRMNRVKMGDTSDTNSDFDRIGSSVSAGIFLKDALANNEDMFYLNTILTICAYTLDDLIWKIGEVKKIFTSMDLGFKMLNFYHDIAFRSTLPLCNLDTNLFKKSKQNVPTSSASSIYPFVSFEMNDVNGILYGVNTSNDTLVTIDNFNSTKYKNANVAILGSSGSGKTYLMQLLALRMRQKNIQVFILAPLEGIAFKRACDKIGGAFISISAASRDCINILEIRKVEKGEEGLLFGNDMEQSYLIEKISKVMIFFSLIMGEELKGRKRNILDDALRDAYKSKGITSDNTSLYANNGSEKYKQMPILEDVYNCILSNDENVDPVTNRLLPDADEIVIALKPYIFGSIRSFNGQTNVDLDNKYIVLDLSRLSQETLTTGMFVALDYMWDKVKEDKTKKKVIFLDELWKLIGASSNYMAANYVLEIFKTIRNRGGSAIAATQDINDFFALEDGKYGKGIINAAKTKIVLGLESEEAMRTQEILNLTNNETMNITKFKRGEGLISANENNVYIKIKASKKESEIITTDRSELEKQAKELREKIREEERNYE